jgi:hypothetical protein
MEASGYKSSRRSRRNEEEVQIKKKLKGLYLPFSHFYAMNKLDIAVVVTLAIITCLLLCTPALANYNFDGWPVVTRESGTAYGGVFIGYTPWAGSTTLTGSFDVPAGYVICARLYTGIWGGRETYAGWVDVTFNDVDDSNGLGPIHLQGESDTNPNVWCSGNGKNWMYYDVTDLVSAGAENTATTRKINATAGNFDGRVYGVVLVVVYEGGDNPKKIQYWINDGSDSLNYISPNDEGTTYFGGTVNTSSVIDAELTMVHLTAYDPSCANCLQFNDNALDTSMITSNTFELNTWDVTNIVAQSGNNACYSRGDDGYISVCNAILTLELPGTAPISVTPRTHDLHFSEEGSVSGEGFVMVDKALLSGQMQVTEHGTGTYSSDEDLELYTKNKSISLEKTTEVEYMPISTTFNSKWTQDICTRNNVIGTALHKKISDAAYIEDETISKGDKNSASMEFESAVVGYTHIGTKSNDAKTSEDYIGEFSISWSESEACKYLFNWNNISGDDNDKLIKFLKDNFDIDWVENATITKSSDGMVITVSTKDHTAEIILDDKKEEATLKIDGTIITCELEVRDEDDKLNVYDCTLEKEPESVHGVGYVMIDEVISKGQMRVIEHGSGIYNSTEDFSLSSIEKSTTAEYMPTYFNFSDSFSVLFPSKWMHDICTKNQKAGTAIHKKISDAAYMEDETIATKSSMEFESSFNGSIHIGVRSKAANISEDYIGEFNVSQVIEVREEKTTSANASDTTDWLSCPFTEPTPTIDLICPFDP